MSLKAKIEAVIYASEEPVTLVQLAGLLGHEAQAELDHLDAVQHALALEENAPDEDELNDEVLEDVPATETDTQHAEALQRHLHDAAAEEAAHARAARLRAAAATAAMSSADSVEPILAIFQTESAAEEQGSDAPAAAVQATEADEKKLARETKEKERRLREYFRTILDQLIADYASSDRGLRFARSPAVIVWPPSLSTMTPSAASLKSLKPPLKLSLQALETLAVVAYKQPVTAPEISEIRGVDSGGVLGSLMARKLITTAGRKQVIGRPFSTRPQRTSSCASD